MPGLPPRSDEKAITPPPLALSGGNGEGTGEGGTEGAVEDATGDEVGVAPAGTDVAGGWIGVASGTGELEGWATAHPAATSARTARAVRAWVPILILLDRALGAPMPPGGNRQITIGSRTQQLAARSTPRPSRLSRRRMGRRGRRPAA